MGKPNHIIFFDGVCNLCNKSINILVRIDRNQNLRYSSLQGQLAKEALNGKNIEGIDSFVFLSNDEVLIKSEAAVKILQCLGGGYKVLGYVLSIFPYGFLNVFYNLIAKNRYRIFGRSEQCRIPSKEEAHLFIE